MSYSLEQAVKQLVRHKGRAVMSFLQLFLALLIVQSVFTVYQDKQKQFDSMMNAFGVGLYQLNIAYVGELINGPPPKTDLVPEQWAALEYYANGHYEIYEVVQSTVRVPDVAEPLELIRMDKRFYEAVAASMGYAKPPAFLISPALITEASKNWEINGQQLQITNSAVVNQELLQHVITTYRFLPRWYAIQPVDAESLRRSDNGRREVWLQGMETFSTSVRGQLLKELEAKGTGEWTYAYKPALEYPQQELDYVKLVASAFLLFGIFILLVSTIGMVGTNFVAFLSKRHEWATHMVYGSSRWDLIRVQVYYFSILSLSAILLSLAGSKLLLQQFFPDLTVNLPLIGGISLLLAFVVGTVTLIPYLQIRQIRLSEALKQER
ncbi:hypothetical protein CIG75_20380 [Tumebacillus algifaecis]|uniref:ABC3 transporter permease C-terminal domain-containing protein n=1 Tax=Tumebacillus algifaecis TaxID=1214604 RepID=A0A223D644_9BACL|nr:FtsX-like permease family protein [Tumebacillus algifaecis]ASS77025.1 hypothetical protein CIG75_20380 [Tumebacillus algifaecis]